MKSCKTVYTGPEWAFAAARAGNVVLWMSTISPESLRQLHNQLVSSMSILGEVAAIVGFHRKGVQNELHVAIKIGNEKSASRP
jgi:3-hydroxyisobutyrate dehydrogenase-like beta-hydroxyacid dehydrogenase